MGVDCKIVLPGNVRVDDVALVLGASAGLKKEWAPYDFKSARVLGVEINSIDGIPTCVNIELKGDLIDGFKHHHVMYYFEYHGLRLLMPRSTGFWIACGHRLVDFFGGRIDYKDCDDESKDYFVPKKSRKLNCPDDGEAWDKFEERIMAIEPITKVELEEYSKYAVYSYPKGE